LLKYRPQSDQLLRCFADDI